MPFLIADYLVHLKSWPLVGKNGTEDHQPEAFVFHLNAVGFLSEKIGLKNSLALLFVSG